MPRFHGCWETAWSPVNGMNLSVSHLQSILPRERWAALLPHLENGEMLLDLGCVLMGITEDLTFTYLFLKISAYLLP